MNRREIKKRTAFKIGTAVPGEEKYKIGAVGQIIETIRFILFCDNSFTRGQSNIRRFSHERSVTNIRDWSLVYSFIYSFVYILVLDVGCHVQSKKNTSKFLEH